MKTTTTTILVAAGALLVGGAATAAFMNNHNRSDDYSGSADVRPSLDGSRGDSALGNGVGGRLEYADVVRVDPITQQQPHYADVIGVQPLREIATTDVPRQVCHDVVVQERLPRRDVNNIGGTVLGAVVGGLVGNQIGHGGGRRVATAAGAVAGGYIGNRIEENHVGGRVVDRDVRRCHTENGLAESSRITGYDVTYRNDDGTTGTMRMDTRPGSRIELGSQDVVKGYDVTYRYDGLEKTVRMDQKPNSDRLPVLDGRLVTQTASAVDTISQR
ncbi:MULTISPECIES: glycine zipper 2TM domain-containing protein [unclassified Xanthomonas]|uniref:glycine zipper 2TM domain-containing protein n=1 Tax=unclassified Xanthomonas TaxID=2643310 RepID=UPI0005F2CEA4|nr:MULTISPECIES: glycine zipper 2TM domain-containing protein [unclassified Xanthomonas]